MKKLFSILTIGMYCTSNCAHSQTATFNITYTGFTTQAQTAFQYSTDIWANTVVSSVPIKVTAHLTPLLSGTLGITFPNGRKNFSGAPLSDKWYATSLANSIASTELNPGEEDIEMYLNSTVNWNYGTSGTVPTGQYDFVTIVLHELCHGLGFLSLAKDSSGIGSFGMLRNSDFLNLVTAFPWPNLDTMPSIFDYYIVDNLNQKLDSLTNPSTLLSTKFKSNNLYFNGLNAINANGGIKPRIYAPGTFALGSSVTHLNEATYPAGNPNELMTPNGTPAYSLHNPGPLCIGILKDIGWNINPFLDVDEFSLARNNIEIYPNPSNATFTVHSGDAKINQIKISNIFGVEIKTITNNSLVDLTDFPKGIYIASIQTENGICAKKIVIQ